MILEGVPRTILNQMNNDLTKPIDEKEIKETLLAMNANQAPDPDGMAPMFFKKIWHIVKTDIINAIKSFFHSGIILRAINHTNHLPNP